jgi:osmotically-inducible protein OsmY
MVHDDDVLRRVDTALRQHPHLRSVLIESQRQGNQVILHGAVDSFFMKQMAQEAIRSLDDAPLIVNQIVVRGVPHCAPEISS